MRQKKNIFLLFLVVIFFISTTGVTVYKHHCSHGGMFYGVFVDVSHDCEPEIVEAVNDSNECCATTSSNGLQVEEECCTSDVQMYQIDTDLATNDSKIEFVNHFTYSFSNSLYFSIPEYRVITISNKAPPALTTPKRLSLYQIYLI